MASLDVYNWENQKVGQLDVNDEIFNVEVREHLFHELVTAHMAAKRQGSAKIKGRSEVRGSGAKVWKQKGTGRARQGNKKGPHWVGGGVAHGPQQRSYAKKVNKKTRWAGLCAALSRRQQEGKLIVIDDLALAAPRTKDIIKALASFETRSALFCDVDNKNLLLSARNAAKVEFSAAAQLNVYDILKHETVLISKSAIEAIEARAK